MKGILTQKTKNRPEDRFFCKCGGRGRSRTCDRLAFVLAPGTQFSLLIDTIKSEHVYFSVQ